MSRCEVCGEPATMTCGGLDVPMLGFCAVHGPEHRRICPDVRDGRAAVVRHEKFSEELTWTPQQGSSKRDATSSPRMVTSLTIYHVLTGRRLARDCADIPYDPDDFGRCFRLLNVMPSWRERLPEVAERYPAWAPFVAAWDELTALYLEELPSGRCQKLYDRMLRIRDDLDKQLE